ncbi:MAG: hypothetical protein MZW92_14550 [Comamonadaceae bacterium]|nr:hypothetical protein [Comamonadaceae bacterium]
MADHAPLKSFHPAWFTTVMGLSRPVARLASRRAADGRRWPVPSSLAVGALAALVFAALAAAFALRVARHPEAWAEDRRHPVRHPFVAAMPVAVILLATRGDGAAGRRRAGSRRCGGPAALGQLAVTVLGAAALVARPAGRRPAVGRASRRRC